jgi:hypothetical protein
MLVATGCALLCATSCGARDSVETVEDDAGFTATGARGGFKTPNIEEPFSSPGTWDFGVQSDGPVGKPCDPANPEPCGPDLLCCRVSRELQVCTQAIRSGECPKIPNGPSGGKSTNKDPGPRPAH